jgi:hypothetical protein
MLTVSAQLDALILKISAKSKVIMAAAPDGNCYGAATHMLQRPQPWLAVAATTCANRAVSGVQCIGKVPWVQLLPGT